MKKNLIMPFALTALLGITAMIVLGGVGISQQDHAEGDSGSGEVTASAEELVEQQNCVSCHGADLSGTGTAPNIKNLQDKYSMEELVDVINNGVEDSNLMTGDYANEEQAKVIAEWLLNGKE
ncbi:c-type cytochrome [Filobacillus milosensis]|uniref:C-type cytochrome n=1 Tax=Filobacillus milosensis TaxID=94137 RepID=A0A4Y8IUF4_9BACI|nr:cytochrome c [Filobacillus milosensis]TFB24829.1 c-type cytochrome [Filobacillus milosensis]